MQVMAKFKAQFCSAISSILPIVNMSTGSYEFTKNSSKLKFEGTICLSHTNDRDWVSGVYRGPETKAKESENEYDNKQDRANTKSMIKELDENADIIKETSGRKHALTPIALSKAIQLYNSKKISQRMLETAIKACSRSELEFYVLRSVGIEAAVDVSDVKPGSVIEDTPEEDEEKDNKNANESLSEGTIGPRFERADFKVNDAFKAKEILDGKGVISNARTGTVISVKW